LGSICDSVPKAQNVNIATIKALIVIRNIVASSFSFSLHVAPYRRLRPLQASPELAG
jgi:hypothetical protein